MATAVKIAVQTFSGNQPFKPINIANLLIMRPLCVASQAKGGRDANTYGTSKIFFEPLPSDRSFMFGDAERRRRSRAGITSAAIE
jgi:hypothetical protein